MQTTLVIVVWQNNLHVCDQTARVQGRSHTMKARGHGEFGVGCGDDARCCDCRRAALFAREDAGRRGSNIAMQLAVFVGCRRGEARLYVVRWD